MAKKEITISGERAYFSDMTLKGGKLPDDFEVDFDVCMDFTGVTREQLIAVCASGQSGRVRWQGQLRRLSTVTLRKMAEKQVTVKMTDILKGLSVGPVDLILTYNRIDFVATIMSLNPMQDEDEAHEAYNRKHGLEQGSRE